MILEINKKRVHDVDEFAVLLAQAMENGNFTVGTWEPTTAEDQGSGQQLNFHFVPNHLD